MVTTACRSPSTPAVLQEAANDRLARGKPAPTFLQQRLRLSPAAQLQLARLRLALAHEPADALRTESLAVDGWIAAMPAGRALLALQSDAAAISRLDAGRFNAHVRDEGLREVQAHRATEGRSRDAGTERYSRHAKALVDGGCPQGLRLLFEGQPLAGAQVRRVSLDDTARPDERSLTDAQGMAWFPAAGAGRWMLAAVWSRPPAQPAPVSYETFFATFTFAARTSHPPCPTPPTASGTPRR